MGVWGTSLYANDTKINIHIMKYGVMDESTTIVNMDLILAMEEENGK